VPQITLAIEGKGEFVMQTNPFGPSKPKKKSEEQKLQEQRTLFHRAKMDARQRQLDKRTGKHGK